MYAVEQPYQPRLNLWSHVWRIGLALTISLLGLVGVAGSWSVGRWALDLSIALVAYASVFWRRRWPVQVALVAAVASAFSAMAGGAAAFAMISLATRRRWREILPVALLNAGAGLAWNEIFKTGAAGSFWLNLFLTVVAIGAVTAWGMYIGSRRELLWTLRQRAERAEAEQALRVAQARETERRRIAREMHDVLAHRISQISMHAGALAYRTDLPADELRKDVGEIRDRAHEALSDLRGVLGVLRGGADGAELAPQPTYADLPGLLDRARDDGMRITLVDTLDAEPTESAGRTVYRIVQEGITNAGKHAPGAALEVTLSGSPQEGLSIGLRNALGFDSGTPGAGIGLIGLTERAELAGGRLTHEVEGGAFVLTAWIPWSA
ncbi:MAG: histidine kinase [Nocardioides sp.]|nr:histidine kinase [Nocardioides sp.]